MLTQLNIRNFTIVERLDLALTKGMTVLTGETGAGKSILLDALLLAMGGRADNSAIRNGETRAEIAAEFDIRNSESIKQWLVDNELDEEQDCLIRRTINNDGRSRGFINGRPVPMQLLRELGDLLVDIHGQHAHQSLLKRHLQRQALDDYAAHADLLNEVNRHFQQWKTLCEQQTALARSREEREARIELLSYQTQELNDLDMAENEMTTLGEEHTRLANLSLIVEGGANALYTLTENEDTSIAQLLSQTTGEIEHLLQFDHSLHDVSQMLTEATIQVQEASTELRHYLDSLSLDPERLDLLNERLGLIHDLSRKHRVDPHALPELQQRLSEELAVLQSDSEQSDTLDTAITQAANDYLAAAKKLTQQRTKAAKTLSALVTDNMQQLGMKQGQFKIQLEPLDEISANGMERAEFLVTANPGQPFKPMNKVASGGELSRISLAIQVITAGTSRIPTLIFDEVDVGIGGGIAEIVGHLLRNLSNDRQVLCITHQPQVASLAQHHLHVSKVSTANNTQSTVAPLNAKQRTEEIARMLGGLEITAQTRSHAEEMIERSKLVTTDI